MSLQTLNTLSEQQIDQLLLKQVIGRIACSHKDFIYLVPISYAYDGKNIYARTFEGTKLNIMRLNPNVCFEVDDISDMANWKSAITWGTFEELKEEDERKKALKILTQRHLPLSSSITTHLGKTWPFAEDDLQEMEGVLFRINLTKKTGRFECSSYTDMILD
jgi:nitroimidazol reductase NimA-like FMN-containing flavoprotein (pyridoxamine 5'-phosphate oxidase superfamily)